MVPKHLVLSLASIIPFCTASAVPRDEGVLPRSSVWQPAVGAQFQMILYGILNINATEPTVSPDVEIYDVDLFETPKDAITSLHKMGKKVICYFSAGTSENWRPDFPKFKETDLGVNLTYWPGERWLDIRSTTVLNVMKDRIKLASEKGCDAVDPDDVDVFSNDNGGGFKTPVSEADSIRFFKVLSDEAHRYNIAIGLKNAIEILPKVSQYAEFAVNEECVWEGNCNVYTDFTKGGKTRDGKQVVGKPVFHVEYVSHYDLTLLTTNATSINVTGSDNTTLTPSISSDNSIFIWSFLWPNVTALSLRSTLCLQDNAVTAESSAEKLKLSTILKELLVDGWMMDCEGRSRVTNITYPNRTAVARGQPAPVRRDVPMPVSLADIEAAERESDSPAVRREVVLPRALAMKERKRAWRASNRQRG